jgi:uncharacterized protein
MAGMRRFLIGLISGAFVAVLGLVLVSQIAPPPMAQSTGTDLPINSTGGIPNETAITADAVETPLTKASEPAQDSAALGPLPDAPAPASPVVAVPDAGQITPPTPQTAASGAASDVSAPEAAPDAVIVAAPAPEAVAPSPQPETDTANAADVVPSAPVGPDGPAPDTVAAPENDEVPATPPAAPQTDLAQLRPAADAPDAVAAPTPDTTAGLGDTGVAAPAAPGADAPPPLAELPPPPPLTPEEEAVLSPAPPEAVAVTEEPAAADAAARVPPPAPEVIAQLPIPEEERPAVLDVDAGPSVLRPDTPLIDASPDLPVTPSLGSAGGGVIVNRAAEPDAASGGPLTPEPPVAAAPPVDRFAAVFENPDAKPLFSIVLIDTGEAALDRMAIASLPFAVSVAIDPLAPDAAAHAALYRAGGKEVLMLASGIPDGASPSDLEQTFQALDAALPEAVAVVDTEDASFQDDRPLATQIVPILAAQGRGLLTWDRGLNAADQVARREGLAAAVIFRRIDGDGEAAPAIRRYLDRAAFKAAQEGQVTVIGHVQPETVAALLEWTIEGRASSVAIAPVSAQLSLR